MCSREGRDNKVLIIHVIKKIEILEYTSKLVYCEGGRVLQQWTTGVKLRKFLILFLLLVCVDVWIFNVLFRWFLGESVLVECNLCSLFAYVSLSVLSALLSCQYFFPPNHWPNFNQSWQRESGFRYVKFIWGF